MIQCDTAKNRDLARDYFRDYLDHGVHDVPGRIRRVIVDLLSASYIADVHGDEGRASIKIADARDLAARYGLHI